MTLMADFKDIVSKKRPSLRFSSFELINIRLTRLEQRHGKTKNAVPFMIQNRRKTSIGERLTVSLTPQ